MSAGGDPNAPYGWGAPVGTGWFEDDQGVEHTFLAAVSPPEVEEGNYIYLYLWRHYYVQSDPTAPPLEFWLEGHSAEAAADYITQYTISNGTSPGFQLVQIPTLNDALAEGSESLKIHVRYYGRPDTEVELEARILPSDGGSDPPTNAPDDDRVAFWGRVSPATEGQPVRLVLTAEEPLELEYWVRDVSAIHGVDYVADLARHTITVGPGQPALILFPTIDNTIHTSTRSFKIHFQAVGDNTSRRWLEADIYDNDMTYAASHSLQYAYDAFDQLVWREEDPDGDGPGYKDYSVFSWENGQIALQFGFDILWHRYLYGPAVDQILADENVLEPVPSGVLWPLTDHLGTPRDLVTYNAATDTTTRASHRLYDSYGNLLSETNPNVDLLVGYAGGLYEVATGLYYFRARWLDPKTGRWLSEDPISFGGGDTNLYRYVGNSPTNDVDPSGLARVNLFGSGPLFGSGGADRGEVQGPREWSWPLT